MLQSFYTNPINATLFGERFVEASLYYKEEVFCPVWGSFTEKLPESDYFLGTLVTGVHALASSFFDRLSFLNYSRYFGASLLQRPLERFRERGVYRAGIRILEFLPAIARLLSWAGRASPHLLNHWVNHKVVKVLLPFTEAASRTLYQVGCSPDTDKKSFSLLLNNQQTCDVWKSWDESYFPVLRQMGMPLLLLTSAPSYDLGRLNEEGYRQFTEVHDGGREFMANPPKSESLIREVKNYFLREGGRGSDIVSYEDTGHSPFPSWEILATYGRFLQGGRDSYLRPFSFRRFVTRGLSFCADYQLLPAFLSLIQTSSTYARSLACPSSVDENFREVFCNKHCLPLNLSYREIRERWDREEAELDKEIRKGIGELTGEGSEVHEGRFLLSASEQNTLGAKKGLENEIAKMKEIVRQWSERADEAEKRAIESEYRRMEEELQGLKSKTEKGEYLKKYYLEMIEDPIYRKFHPEDFPKDERLITEIARYRLYRKHHGETKK